MPKIEDPEEYWTNEVKKLLLGRKIISIRYLTQEEKEDFGWNSRSIALELDNGIWIFPSRDDEGNDAGALFTSAEELYTIPVIN